jgi:ketosteroid isomerase-like protein
MKNLATRVVLSLLLLVPLNAVAQEWSAAQKDVWASVEAYWALDAQGKTKEFMEYFDADYAGWHVRNPLPSTKASSTKFISYGHKTSKTLVYDIQPVAIKVHGQFAFVHYYYNQMVKNAEGKDEPNGGRWTDILMKQGDKWVLIGDSGGTISKN